ncbi:MAG: hypothetical protein Q9210_005141 [Variospora velana]
MSCYTHRAIENASDSGEPFHCRLDVIRSPTGLGPFATHSAAQISSCFLNSNEITDSRHGLLDTPRFDETLDGNACVVGSIGTLSRGSAVNHLEEIQVGSRRLCCVLRLLSHPDKNIITISLADSVDPADLVLGLLRQLYHKATTLWVAFFANLRVWVSEPRKKANFAQHRSTAATSLAQLSACVKSYTEAFARWSDQGVPMLGLANDITRLSTYLEYLGKGIEMRSFNAEDTQPWMDTLPVHLSISTGDHLRDTNRQVFSNSVRIGCLRVAHTRPTAAIPPSTTFLLRIGRKPPLRLSGLQRTTQEQRPFQSPSYMRPSPRATSVDAPTCSNDLLAPVSEDLQDFDFSTRTDPDTERALIERTERQLEDLRRELQKAEQTRSYLKEDFRSQLQKVEQTCSHLEEEIHYGEMILGVAKAPDHSIFDDALPTTLSDATDQSDSPGAMTLVDSGLEAEIPSAVEDEFADISPTPNPAFCSTDAEDILMHESLANHPSNDIDHTSVMAKKRKRFSRHSTCKKIRIQKQTQHHPAKSTLLSCTNRDNDESPHDVDSDGKDMSQTQVDDDSKPSSTTRPTSWPRTRLFRRSAGVSVKKLADAFEKLRMNGTRL